MELSELIESVDILEYISQFTDFTEKNGEYWALSPLKDENTPSFSVRKETNSFYDFSSGVGGGLITFIRRYYNCGYHEAVDKIREYVGADGDIQIKKKLSATRVAKRYSTSPRNKKTLRTMPVLPDDYMERFEKRTDKLAVWENEGISRETLDVYQVRYDAFSNRLVYPIRNTEGKIVNVGGRTLDDDWKEKGYRKYTYFKPWEYGMQVIYGLYENMEFIQQKQQIIIFEGAKSVMMAHSNGVKNSSALLTSHLNPFQQKMLIKLGFDVVFALDNDICPKDDQNIKKLRQYLNIYYVQDTKNRLGAKDSPIDKGIDVFNELLDERRRLV